MIGGEEYAIVDIGMRMLTPRELFLMQGFPEGYRIADAVQTRFRTAGKLNEEGADPTCGKLSPAARGRRPHSSEPGAGGSAGGSSMKRPYSKAFTPKGDGAAYKLDRIPLSLWRRFRAKCKVSKVSVRARLLTLIMKDTES